MDILPSPAGRLAGPEPLTAEEMAAYVVAAAVWAPSVHNTQPWWFSAARAGDQPVCRRRAAADGGRSRAAAR